MNRDVVAGLSLAKSELIAQQDSDCTATLVNQSARPLTDLNPRNRFSFPSIEVTDLSNGNISVFDRKISVASGTYGDEVDRGAKWEKTVSLSDWIGVHPPGYYDLRALHHWDGGSREVVSLPVRLTIEPARPMNTFVADCAGGRNGLTTAAWLREVDPVNGQYEVWVSTLNLRGVPELRQVQAAAALDEAVQPVVSSPDSGQDQRWIVWTSDRDNDLHFLLERAGECSGIATEALGVAARIVPPLIDDGEDVFVVCDAGGELLAARLNAAREPRTSRLVEYRGGPAAWAKTAVLPDGRRYTFLLQTKGNRAIAQLTDWKDVQILGTWNAKVISADSRVLEDGTVAGAFLIEEAEGDAYVMNPWRWKPGAGFRPGDPIPIQWPAGMPLVKGLVRVDRGGMPWALLKGFTPEKMSYISGPKGDLHPLPGDAGAPCELLLTGRGAYALCEHPELGFRFTPGDATLPHQDLGR